MQIKKDKHGMPWGHPGVMQWVSENGGRFANWDRSFNPNSMMEEDLASAIDIGVVTQIHEYFRIYLSWAVEAADRALRDVRFTIDPESDGEEHDIELKKRGWCNEGVYPGNHGSTLAGGCFAWALRDNNELDTTSLLLAADEIAESAMHGGLKFWDYVAQSEYLRSVRLSLIAGDVEKAASFFKNCRRKFKFTYVHEQWLKRLIEDIQAAGDAPLSGDAEQHFQNFFDQVRDPDAKLASNQSDGTDLFANISILRLELAIIKQRYVLKQPIAGNWKSILCLISE